MNAMSDLVFAKVISVCNCFVLFVYISWFNKKKLYHLKKYCYTNSFSCSYYI